MRGQLELENKNKEIDSLIKAIKDSNAWDDGEKYRAINKLEESRPKQVGPASKEELDNVMEGLFPEIPRSPKPENEKTTEDKFLDEIVKYI